MLRDLIAVKIYTPAVLVGFHGKIAAVVPDVGTAMRVRNVKQEGRNNDK